MKRACVEFCSRCCITLGAATLVLLVGARPAQALQPLADFLAGARQASTDERVAALSAVQQQAEALITLGRSLPAASARGLYTQNQYESRLNPSEFTGGQPIPGAQTLVLQPANQLDAYLQLDLPIVDLAGWARSRGAWLNARAAVANAAATVLEVEKQVARNYYQLVGAEALRVAALKTEAAARQNLALAEERLTSGVATALDVDRATAEVERALQSISEAELTSELSRQALRTLTGIEPAGEAAALSDELQEEPPLERWEGGGLESLPSVMASVEQRRSAEAYAHAAGLAFVPTVVASGQEHFTNAEGFVGHRSVWVATLTANWKLDLGTFGTLRSQQTGAEIARTREIAARQNARDRVHESWFRVHSGIVKSRAARAQALASLAAVSRARERYQQGAGTEFELVQAERDAFSAEVARIQADADLSYSRVALRLDAGRPLDEEAKP
jgi:outer membrane protein TolC